MRSVSRVTERHVERIRIASVPPVRPKLLVSVRNSVEAFAAVSGGADIIDVKEPANGSLGRASLSAIQSIAERIALHRVSTASSGAAHFHSELSELQLSVALGEVAEWIGGRGSWRGDVISFLPQARPRYLKLGLAGLGSRGKSPTAWISSWMHVREQFRGDHKWVAVAYADHLRADSPAVESVCAAAAGSGCSVLLIDTFEKDGSNVFDFMTAGQLRSVRSCTAQAGLQLAVAGRITECELSSVLPIGPDIIAVRGAICEAGRRTAAVCEEKVRRFVEAIEAEAVRSAGRQE